MKPIPKLDPIQALAEALHAVMALSRELPLLLTPEQVSRLVGLEPGTLANLRCIGGGPPYTKRGTNVFYPRKELLAWVEAMPLYRHTTDESERKAGDARHRQDRHGMQTNDPE